MTTDGINKMHGGLMKSSTLTPENIGNFRTEQVFLGAPGVPISEFIFPPPAEEVPELMQVCG